MPLVTCDNAASLPTALLCLETRSGRDQTEHHASFSSGLGAHGFRVTKHHHDSYILTFPSQGSLLPTNFLDVFGMINSELLGVSALQCVCVCD